LIDTPGFDDSERQDADVLAEIAEFLAASYWNGIFLNGIILLQPVEGNRGYGSEKRRTRLFRRICGPDAYSHVVIGTTMWSKISNRADGFRMVEQRQDSPDFWAQLVGHGAEIVEHQDTRESALNIIRKVMHKDKTILQLQTELANADGRLSGTSAGKQLAEDLGQSSQREKDKLDTLYRDIDEMRKSQYNYEEKIVMLLDKIQNLQEQKRRLETLQVS
jgi:hypothetical protein